MRKDDRVDGGDRFSWDALKLGQACERPTHNHCDTEQIPVARDTQNWRHQTTETNSTVSVIQGAMTPQYPVASRRFGY